MTDRHEKPARGKPAAGVDHRVEYAARRRLQDETVEIAQLAAVGAPNVETVEVDGGVIDIISVEISQA